MSENIHWYAYSYIGKDVFGHPSNGSVYIGYRDKKITKSRIQNNKKHAGVRDDAVLIAVTYCGYMTKEEFMENE